MSSFIKDLVSKKLQQLSYEELLRYSKQYGFKLHETEAKSIISYLQNNQIDPFDPADRSKMVHELARITDQQTAKKAEKLFADIIKSYGLEHLFM